MWKDFFYLTKRERVSVWVMTVLVMILQIGIWTSDLWLLPVLHMLKPQMEPSSPVEASPGNTISTRPADVEHGAVLPVLHAFNPNTADSSVLRGLGLRSKVVRNILKYRSKGGQFRKPDDLAKIYGLDAEVFKRLRPYIRLSETNSANVYGGGEAHPDKRDARVMEQAPESKTPVLVAVPVSSSSEPLSLSVEAPATTRSTASSSLSPRFELNEADTATLQLLKGVGTVTAGRIVRYRQQLGGFYDVRQLNEIKGLYPTVLETLTKTVSVNPDRITKININKASLEKLKAHPYLNFYQAKVIVELRKSRKSIRALSDLSAFSEFSSADLERLKWYLEL